MNIWDRYRDKRIVRSATLRAQQYGVDGAFTIEEWRKLCQYYGYCCVSCHEMAPLTADHVIPLASGGSNWIDNIQPLCQSCNSKKRRYSTDFRVGEQLPPKVEPKKRPRRAVQLDRDTALMLRDLACGQESEYVADLIRQAWMRENSS